MVRYLHKRVVLPPPPPLITFPRQQLSAQNHHSDFPCRLLWNEMVQHGTQIFLADQCGMRWSSMVSLGVNWDLLVSLCNTRCLLVSLRLISSNLKQRFYINQFNLAHDGIFWYFVLFLKIDQIPPSYQIHQTDRSWQLKIARNKR